MNLQLRKKFITLLESTLNSDQIKYLGESLDGKFNIYKESGYGQSIPIPTTNAAETLVDYFATEENLVQLFTILLVSEGKHFNNRNFVIFNRDLFIDYLEKNKWILDRDLMIFFRDPFYENEINQLKKIRVVDLRDEINVKNITKDVSEIIKTLGDKDLEWTINLRLYDLDRDNSELIRKIIEMLLVRQNLKPIAFEIYTCLKELALNASKANYKILFEKYISAPQNITSHKNYSKFLELFKEEIENFGNTRMLDFAKKDNKYSNITFQSTNESIEIWVINSQNISTVEKKAIMKRLGYKQKNNVMDFYNEENAEGAGLGLMLILNVLKKYTSKPNPLSVVFYPNYIKFGFSLNRKEALELIEKRKLENN